MVVEVVVEISVVVEVVVEISVLVEVVVEISVVVVWTHKTIFCLGYCFVCLTTPSQLVLFCWQRHTWVSSDQPLQQCLISKKVPEEMLTFIYVLLNV